MCVQNEMGDREHRNKHLLLHGGMSENASLRCYREVNFNVISLHFSPNFSNSNSYRPTYKHDNLNNVRNSMNITLLMSANVKPSILHVWGLKARPHGGQLPDGQTLLPDHAEKREFALMTSEASTTG